MSEYSIEELYTKIDRLIDYCAELKNNNQGLKLREQQLLHEREKLIEKNELARTRVEAMIGELKSLQSVR